ncbi:MAG: phosphoserine phosphatase RsbU/P [Pseudomonadota bacterium]|nr:phosphoserine phosphatase RsbU/P [Pseudomonadota bacterium]
MSYINLDDRIHASNIPDIPDLARGFLQLHAHNILDRPALEALQKQYPDFIARMLAVFNSDHFNLTTKVASIEEAIHLAGFERVCRLMLCLVVHRSFSNIRIRGVDQEAFWVDSLRRAVSARMIGELIGLDASLCFTAGFLQDVGFLLLFLLSPNKGMLWTEFRKREPDARYSMERNIFNMNHDQAMELFCQQWNLHDVMAKPVLAHHRCEKYDAPELDKQLCKVLHCADWMAAVYVAVDKNFVINRCRQILAETFEMERFRTEELLAAIPDEITLTASVLGIPVKEHTKFSQVLLEANIKLSEDNLNFQELTLRLEQALDERDRLAAELNKELGLAREIQRSLLPQDMGAGFPLTGINISARDLSGDFYDYFTLPDGRIYFNLGDVSGKGVNAALLMAKTSSLFRCLGKRIDHPGELLAQINIELCETSIHGMFVTMIAGIYDPETGLLKLVNAGNPPALLFSPHGLAREIEAAAPPLGVLEDSKFPEISLSLGDNSLYMFSDGVTEGYTENGQTLGLSGLFKAIATMPEQMTPQQRIANIVKRIRHDDQSPLRDDVTILLLQK